ncbi:MAG: plasmid recombination protein [Streptococcus lutetiensis]|nr:plasmid recombination protein [Streptococcus lutetiensis]MDU2564903.1 plasmid recombination protein [Streptococcus lutetiensis]MDU2581796.1 plasmid recombination protein [Veillonella sp.]
MGVGVSFSQNKGNLSHNERKFYTNNIDIDRSKDNLQFYSLSVEEAYKEYFGNAIDEYNRTQKRKDRIKSVDKYLFELRENEHKKGAEKPFYEIVVQIGDKNTCNILNNKEQAENAKNVLIEYVKGWQDRNPNLRVFNATIHMDETTPHLHLDYIPVATGYKQGLKVRNSLSKALECQGLGKGVGRNDNASIRWQKQEREVIKDLAINHGFEIEEKGVDRPHLSVSEYKRASDDLNERIERNLEVLEVSKTKVPFSDKVMIKESDLAALKNLSKLGQQARNAATEHDLALTADFELKNKQLKDREYQITNQENKITQKLKEAEKALQIATSAKEIAQEQEKNSKHMKSVYEKLYNEQKNLNQEYSELLKKNVSFSQEISKLSDDIKYLKQTHSEKVTSLNTQIAQAKNDVSKLENQIAEKDAQHIKALSNLKRQYEQEANKLKEQYKNELKEIRVSSHETGYNQGMNDGKDATEKQMNILIGEAYQNGITKGLEESVKDFIKNHQIPVTVHQRFGNDIDKPFAITEPVTGVKFNVTGKEREKYFILSADKIKSYYEERKKTMQKILGQGRGR